MQLRASVRKTAEGNRGNGGRAGERFDHRADRNLRRTLGRKAVDARRDGGKRNRSQIVSLAQRQRAAVARRQRLILAGVPAVPHGPDGMQHMLCRQPVTWCDLDVASGAAIQGAAGGEQFGAGSAMDGTIDATAAEQRRIGGVDNGINAQGRDVGNDNPQGRRAELTACRNQAFAGAAITPFSASSACNSPAWNISRMMSQPPTNSPLT
jgi:hypothetical protein